MTLSHCSHTRKMVWRAHCRFSAVRCSSPSSAFSPLLQPQGQDAHTLPFLTSESQQHFLSWPFQLLSLLWLSSGSFSFKFCWVKRVITNYGVQTTSNELNSYGYIVINKQNISVSPWKYITYYIFRLAAINNMLKTNDIWILLISVPCSKTKFLFTFLYFTWPLFPK